MTSPSKPLSIGSSPRLQATDNNAQFQESSANNTPDLRQQLRDRFGTPPVGTNIPAYRGSPAINANAFATGTPVRIGSPLSRSNAAIAQENIASSSIPVEPPADATRSPPPELPEEEKIKVLRRHLVSSREPRSSQPTGPQSRQSSRSRSKSRRTSPHGSTGLAVPSRGSNSNPSPSRRVSRTPSPAASDSSETFPLPYNVPGGDITHDIYKYQERAHRNARPRTVSMVVPPISEQDPAFEHIHEPGGFRRNFILLRANEQGLEEPPVTSTFIDFLYIFGHFGGENLEEDSDEDEDDEDAVVIVDEEAPPYVPSTQAAGSSQGMIRRYSSRKNIQVVEEPSHRRKSMGQGVDESTPLISTSPTMQRRFSHRSLSRQRRSRRSSMGPHGNATVSQAILMLLKAFIGTGILFLGKAFANGGMLFSAVTLVLIALISLYSFLLLVDTKMVVPGSFGDIGGAIYGEWMRRAILTSIVVSQLGFVAAYTIFVAENLQAFVMSVTKCQTLIPVQLLIFGQLVVFLPLALIRNLAKLSVTALVADVFILIGIVYIGWNEVAVIAENGIAPVRWFNEKDFPLLIGTAVFSFEGIGLVIPITDSMREPHRFPGVLTGVMFFLIALFGGAGVLSYAAYGSDVQTVVIKNLPQDSKFVQGVQFLYSLAILLSAPLQIFPALRIMENWLFTQSGKVDIRVKWQKNFFRMCVVIATYFVSWFGAQDLDKFVSFVGSFACVPLCFIYPAMLHLKAVARTPKQRVLDWLMIAFGTIAGIFSTAQTIKLAATPSAGEGGPKFENCPQPPSPGGNGLLWG